MSFPRFAQKLTALSFPGFQPSTSLGCKNSHPLTQGPIDRILQLTFRQQRKHTDNFLIPLFTHSIRQVFENPLPPRSEQQTAFTPPNSLPLGYTISFDPCLFIYLFLIFSLMLNFFMQGEELQEQIHLGLP